ncbi:hypothetical protein [Winogradskyella sp. A3E31]|uniref:hypothetical protein n=1 Tax=Winogradskyella sp. A3E31 TaxID=3349637 RepID=UPI00398B647D
MNEDQKNSEHLKSIPLTNSEILLFFFLPFPFFGVIKKRKNDFNESEIKRFRRYGYDLKIKQAEQMTIYGRIFYVAIIIITTYLLNT